ncbi:MAG: glucose 1-dehydrogenase [Myxococcales bacterium]|nr:glucose 1-dehydrogenase [Myxococcales bacterium]
MKALGVFPGDQGLRLVDHPEPRLVRPSEVKVEVLEVGVCGTDREIAHGLHGAPPTGDPYMILHHEALGRVLEVGAGVEGLAPGDLVVPTVRRPCGHSHCTACRAGRQDFCFTGDFTERGIKGAHGFFAERIVDEAQYFVKLPEALREVGILVEPLTIAEKALLQVWDIQERLPWRARAARAAGDAPKLEALVLGAGPIGLLGALLLVENGFRTHVYSLEEEGSARARLVESIGAEYHSAKEVDVAGLWGRLGDVDLVYEATGASTLSFRVLELLGPNAIFIFTGVPGRKEPIELDAARVMRNLVLENHVLLGTVNAGPDAFHAAVRDLQAFKGKHGEVFETLITARHPMDAFEPLLKGRAQGIKNVIRVCS